MCLFSHFICSFWLLQSYFSVFKSVIKLGVFHSILCSTYLYSVRAFFCILQGEIKDSDLHKCEMIDCSMVHGTMQQSPISHIFSPLFPNLNYSGYLQMREIEEGSVDSYSKLQPPILYICLSSHNLALGFPFVQHVNGIIFVYHLRVTPLSLCRNHWPP